MTELMAGLGYVQTGTGSCGDSGHGSRVYYGKQSSPQHKADASKLSTGWYVSFYGGGA